MLFVNTAEETLHAQNTSWIGCTLPNKHTNTLKLTECTVVFSTGVLIPVCVNIQIIIIIYKYYILEDIFNDRKQSFRKEDSHLQLL